MTVTRDAVIWAYRFILAREPEDEAVIASHMLSGSVEQLRQNLFDCEEYQGRTALAADVPPLLTIGRHQDISTLDVDITHSSIELDRMLQGIAKHWRKFGVEDPHWSVVTSEQFRAANIDDNLDAFYLLGEQQVARLLNPLRRSGLDLGKIGKAMDFGCGVGRLTLPLSRIAGEVVGVDISAPHIALARQRAQTSHVDNVRFDAINSVSDLDRYSDLDLVVSVIVLQHNPPPVAAEILRKLLNALAPNGAAVIQIPTYIIGQNFNVSAYLSRTQPDMEMNFIPQHLIFGIADDTNCRVLEVREDDFMGGDIGLSHTFAFQKR